MLRIHFFIVPDRVKSLCVCVCVCMCVCVCVCMCDTYVAGAFRNDELCRIMKFSQEVVKNGS